jgi:hypothetical protein
MEGGSAAARQSGERAMFETYYPCADRDERPEATDRYCDVPLGVEAAWPPDDADDPAATTAN